jgi:phosphatidylinositol kinase/protein kinase (PI-3  family)
MESVNEPSLADRGHFFVADWLLETNPTADGMRTIFHHLQSIIDKVRKPIVSEKRKRPRVIGFPVLIVREMDNDIIAADIWRRWSDVNAIRIGFDPENVVQYVTNAIDALTRAVQLAPAFPDVVQLLNLFFDHAKHVDIFQSTRSCIAMLQPKLLLQASPQILVQLGHSTPEVAEFVHDTLFNLLKEHFHELIFSVIVMTKSKNATRSKLASRLLDEFREVKPDVYEEVMLIRQCLLRVAVTWGEKALQLIAEGFEHFQHRQFDKLKESLQAIVKLASKPATNVCEMYSHFKAQYGRHITTLEQILRTFNPKNSNSMNQISVWCKVMQDALTEEQKRIHLIQMSAISPALCARTGFFLAVPGTYRPSRPVIRIQYFVGQFSVYMTKQQPKDVVVKGEDGNYYQYLLKGHEDLRLDERIMQFFRLINSLVRKEECFGRNVIQIVCVIPLSPTHGLVQWIPGTETLKNIVEEYRTLHRRDPIEEYTLTEKLSFSAFDSLQPIQKMQIIESILRKLPDNDIADFFWLKARTAESWLKQINTFAISTGMTSIVGYVIGLGDRHPSNLLVDRFSGSVIHIDFGDCFERAAKRQLLPEVVPFRLTRMMVRAMGASGVDGRFRDSFVQMSTLLRENHRVLVMVLEIFVQEPLIDPEEAEKVAAPASGLFVDPLPVRRDASEETGLTTSSEMSLRVRHKLTGQDFEEGAELSVNEQATKLIGMATDPYNLSKMYSGWCPFW